MKTLTINPYFKRLIPPLSPEEYRGLEESILAHGCRDAIKLWRGVIIDGHNRYEICQKHGIKYVVKQIRLSSKKDAAIWIIENQQGRRNLTDGTRIRLALEKAELLKANAKKNPTKTGSKPINTRKTAAKETGISEGKIYMFMKIREMDPELAQKVERGEVKISTAHRMVNVYNKPVEVEMKMVEVWRDLTSEPDISKPYCVRAVMGDIDRIERMYRFIEDKCELVCLGERFEGVVRRLMAQVGVVEGLGV